MGQRMKKSYAQTAEIAIVMMKGNPPCIMLSVGVPTVVDAATIVADTIDILTNRLEESTSAPSTLRLLKNIEAEDKYDLIRDVLAPSTGNFVVTPKEVDSVIDEISQIVANGLNISLHEGIGLEDIDRYK